MRELIQNPVTGVMELSAFAFATILGMNARKQGHQWLATMLWGMVLGYFVEYVNVHDPGAIYHYDQRYDTVGGVPIWVAVGWGVILYAASLTAQRLDVAPALRPLVAAFLAVNIDLSLDPIAEKYKLWSWDAQTHYDFCGVPFDNFLGWIAVVFIYAALARNSLLWADRFVEGKHRPAWVNWTMPPVAAGLSLAVYKYVIKGAISKAVGQGRSSDGLEELLVFAAISLVAVFVTCVYALRGRRDRPINFAILLLPIYFHLLCLVLALTGWNKDVTPILVVAIPANLMVGVTAYAWPFLDTLRDRWGAKFVADVHSVPPPPMPAE